MRQSIIKKKEEVYKDNEEVYKGDEEEVYEGEEEEVYENESDIHNENFSGRGEPFEEFADTIEYVKYVENLTAPSGHCQPSYEPWIPGSQKVLSQMECVPFS